MPEQQWEFLRNLETAEDYWTWHCRVDGAIDRRSTEHLPGFGKALADAIRNGFSPAHDHYVVSDKEWITHFEAGREPRTVRREG